MSLKTSHFFCCQNVNDHVHRQVCTEKGSLFYLEVLERTGSLWRILCKMVGVLLKGLASRTTSQFPVTLWISWWHCYFKNTKTAERRVWETEQDVGSFLWCFGLAGGRRGVFWFSVCLLFLWVLFCFFPFNFFHVTCFQPSSPRGQENLKKNKTKPKTQQQVSNTIFFPLQVKAVSTAVVYLLCLGKC